MKLRQPVAMACVLVGGLIARGGELKVRMVQTNNWKLIGTARMSFTT